MTNQDDQSTEPLALFGGTFDPVHYGHLRCAEEARQKLNLARLTLLPSGTPPHRRAPQASVKQRLEMLSLALQEFPRLEIDDREARRSGPSYMVDTLQELRQECPRRPLLLLLGQDAASGLHSWHQWEQLFELAHLVIMNRPGMKPEYRQDLSKQMERRLSAELEPLINSTAGRVLNLQVSPLDISATTIKSIIRLGRTPGSMLPAAVLRYINENQLYLPA